MTRFEIALSALILFAYSPTLIAIGKFSLAADYYSHALLVPVVSLWLALRVPRRRWAARAERDGRGLWLIALAVLIGLAGRFFDSLLPQGIGFVLAVAGGVLYTRGSAALRALAFPIAFLLFMVPLPVSWVQPAIVRLQLWVSSASADLLQLTGHSLLREGNVLLLPGGGQLFVAEACSGITSLLTMIPLGVVVALLVERTWARRWPILLAIVPLAMLENLLRVVVVVLLAESYGVAFATAESFHQTIGVLSYILTILLLLGLAKLLRGLDALRHK